MPTCNFPEATIAGVTGSEDLTEATSNAGVCPARDPAANTKAALRDGKQYLDTMIYLVMKYCPLSEFGIAIRLVHATRYTRRRA